MADMTSIARPYAKAAFEFAIAHHQIAEWAYLLERMAQIVVDPLCVAFITNPSTSPTQHGQLLMSLLQAFHASDVVSHTQQWVALLAHYKRLLVLPAIAEQFQHLRAAYEKTLTVKVTSFSALSQKQSVELAERLGKRLQRDVTLAVEIDPTILGGMIVHAGNLVFDGSVRTQIENLGAAISAA